MKTSCKQADYFRILTAYHGVCLALSEGIQAGDIFIKTRGTEPTQLCIYKVELPTVPATLTIQHDKSCKTGHTDFEGSPEYYESLYGVTGHIKKQHGQANEQEKDVSVSLIDLSEVYRQVREQLSKDSHLGWEYGSSDEEKPQIEKGNIRTPFGLFEIEGLFSRVLPCNIE